MALVRAGGGRSAGGTIELTRSVMGQILGNVGLSASNNENIFNDDANISKEPSGYWQYADAYIGYQFVNEVNIEYVSYQYMAPTADTCKYKLQYTTDGTEWIDYGEEKIWISQTLTSVEMKVKCKGFRFYFTSAPQTTLHYPGYYVFCIGKVYAYGKTTSATKRKYLYKDGIQNVAWDSSGYATDGNHTNEGGWYLDTASLIPTQSGANPSSGRSRNIITNNIVDVTEYNFLKAIYNNTTTLTLDLSSVSGSGYIYLLSQDTTTLAIGVTNSKINASTDGILIKSNYVDTTPHRVNRIWLEK